MDRQMDERTVSDQGEGERRDFIQGTTDTRQWRTVGYTSLYILLFDIMTGKWPWAVTDYNDNG
ncbi:hypothetical protein QTP88_012431 [Uroleucon formosanum]